MISIQPTASRRRLDARVMSNRRICRDHYLLRLRIEGELPPTQPGQFVQLGCRPPNGWVDLPTMLGETVDWTPGHPPRLHQPELCEPLALLRRPFSLAGRGEDEHGTWIEIIHRVVGVGTRWLAELEQHDPVDLIGPLGNAFRLPEGKSIGLLVGGGVGLPPMFYLAEALAQANWRAIGFVGAMSRDLLAVHLVKGATVPTDGTPALTVEQFARHGFPTVITTDDGSMGMTGRITAGVELALRNLREEERRQAVLFTCGPEPMMRAAAALAEQFGVDCQVCLEQAMACGMGTCQSCIVKIDPTSTGDVPHGQTAEGRPWRYRLACTDGPVFDARDVVWH